MASSPDDDHESDIDDSWSENDEEEDGESNHPVTTSGWKEKLITPGGRSAARLSGQSGASAKGAIEKLDQRERRLSFAAGGAALLFGILIYVVENHDKAHLNKSPDAPATTLVLGLVCGGLLLGATFLGRRAPVGFVALFAFLIFGTSSILLGAPFLALAVWLLYRSYRIQREASAKLRSGALGDRGAVRIHPDSRPLDRVLGADLEAGSQGAGQEGPRHTRGQQALHPQAPPPPAPKPSRRERKTSQASD